MQKMEVHFIIPFSNSSTSKEGAQIQENEDLPSDRWENLPKDIMSDVLTRLNLTHRLRMSLVCKSWHAIVLQDDLKSRQEAPWLLLPQVRNSPDLSFYSLSEGRVLNLETPLSVLGGWCCGSSKGWLAFVSGPKDCPQFDLVNPISGERIELPSLASIPNFESFVLKLTRDQNVSSFVQRVEVLNMGSSGMAVAGIFGYFEVLAVCQPRDKKWTIFERTNKDCFFEDMLFHREVLHIIMTGKSEKTLANQEICLTNSCVKLKVLTPPYGKMNRTSEEGEYENNPDFVIAKKMVAKLYLAESIDQELLMVVKYNDVFMMYQPHDADGNNHESPLKYFRTSEFAVLQNDAEKGSWELAKGLEKQAVFVAMSGSFCMPACSFNMDRGNCIYFAADLERIFDKYAPAASRESGVYYIENGKIERSFPSVRLPMTSRMCWFSVNHSSLCT